MWVYYIIIVVGGIIVLALIGLLISIFLPKDSRLRHFLVGESIADILAEKRDLLKDIKDSMEKKNKDS